MAIDPEQILVEGLVSFISGLLGVSAGAYLAGLYTIKGQLTGRKEMLNDILAEVKGTAKATELSKIEARAESINKIVDEVARTTKETESAKIAARLEKLDQILPEVRAVTETQKRIETTITGGEWNRQWRLNQMREAYGQLIGAVYVLQDYFYIAKFFVGSPNAEEDPDYRAAFEGYRKHAAEFKTASALTRIFGGPKVSSALDEYEHRLRLRMALPEIQRPQQALKDLEHLHYALLEAARADLQVNRENN